MNKSAISRMRETLKYVENPSDLIWSKRKFPSLGVNGNNFENVKCELMEVRTWHELVTKQNLHHSNTCQHIVCKVYYMYTFRFLLSQVWLWRHRAHYFGRRKPQPQVLNWRAQDEMEFWFLPWQTFPIGNRYCSRCGEKRFYNIFLSECFFFFVCYGVTIRTEVKLLMAVL